MSQFFILIIIPRYLHWSTLCISNLFKLKHGAYNLICLGLKHKEYDLFPL